MAYTDLMSPELAFHEAERRATVGVPVSRIMREGLTEGLPPVPAETQEAAPAIGEQMIKGALANTNN